MQVNGFGFYFLFFLVFWFNEFSSCWVRPKKKQEAEEAEEDWRGFGFL
jgi:hypothetical protein